VLQAEPGALSVEPGAFAAGSQPFHLAVTARGLYYGEYRSNPERSPVSIHRSVNGGLSFEVLTELAGVRHVHGVFADPWNPGTLLAASGDDDDESAIWRIEEATGTAERIAGGSQRYRAVTLVPQERHIYFGSDTPRERNFIYRMQRESGRLETLCEVGGSVFWGRSLPDGTIAFSTVVEPSEVNRTRHAELWVGSESGEFRRVARFRDDRLHPKLFQYAQIRFPAGPGASGTLWVSPYACRAHEHSVSYRLPGS
jgi:hypothetical protein